MHTFTGLSGDNAKLPGDKVLGVVKLFGSSQILLFYIFFNLIFILKQIEFKASGMKL